MGTAVAASTSVKGCVGHGVYEGQEEAMSMGILGKALAGIAGSAAILAVVYFLCVLFQSHWLLVCLLAFCLLLFIAYREAKKFKESDGAEGSVVYESWYDVFKCLTVFIVPCILFFLGAYLGQGEAAGIFCILFCGGMTLHIAYASASINRFAVLPVVLIVKLSLSCLWVYSLYSFLNPSGKTAAKRRESRAAAFFGLFLLTPIITMLVLNEEGKEHVRAGLSGRRFSGAAAIRNMLK